MLVDIWKSVFVLYTLSLISQTAQAEPHKLTPPLTINHTIRCSTESAMREIISSYAISDYAGDSALEQAYSNEKMSPHGLRLCNPILSLPLYISQIEVLGLPTSITNEEGKRTNVWLAEVRLGMSPQEADDTGYILLPQNMYEIIFGDEL